MIYENMNALVKEFLDRATNKDCGKYKLPEHTCRTWTHDKGKKYHYHNSGVYPDQSTLYFFDDNYNHVYQDYFDSNEFAEKVNIIFRQFPGDQFFRDIISDQAILTKKFLNLIR